MAGSEAGAQREGSWRDCEAQSAKPPKTWRRRPTRPHFGRLNAPPDSGGAPPLYAPERRGGAARCADAASALREVRTRRARGGGWGLRGAGGASVRVRSASGCGREESEAPQRRHEKRERQTHAAREPAPSCSNRPAGKGRGSAKGGRSERKARCADAMSAGRGQGTISQARRGGKRGTNRGVCVSLTGHTIPVSLS